MWLGNLIGKLLAKLAGGRLHKLIGKELQARVYVVNWLIPNWAAGQTWGSVILVKHHVMNNKQLLEHELVHVKQWRKLGIFFIPAYIWASIVAAFKYGPKSGYRMNKFEVEARKEAGEE
jgi:hypothetical protein